MGHAVDTEQMLPCYLHEVQAVAPAVGNAGTRLPSDAMQGWTNIVLYADIAVEVLSVQLFCNVAYVLVEVSNFV